MPTINRIQLQQSKTDTCEAAIVFNPLYNMNINWALDSTVAPKKELIKEEDRNEKRVCYLFGPTFINNKRRQVNRNRTKVIMYVSRIGYLSFHFTLSNIQYIGNGMITFDDNPDNLMITDSV